jgi:hypothetical protein
MMMAAPPVRISKLQRHGLELARPAARGPSSTNLSPEQSPLNKPLQGISATTSLNELDAGSGAAVADCAHPAVLAARLRLIAGLYPSGTTINIPTKAQPARKISPATSLPV